MYAQLDILRPGSCEGLKAGVHATALGLAILMGVYNSAAWLRRRETHNGVNVVLYAALSAWELKQVAHHVARLRAHGEFERHSTENTIRSIRVVA